MRILLIFLLILCAACIPADDKPTSGTLATPFPAPNFTLATLNGGTFSLDSMKGRWVILNFWATWCTPCVDEMPALKTIAEERSGQIALFAINVGDSADAIKTFMKRYFINIPILLDPDITVRNNYRVELGIPQTDIINPSGLIVWHQFGALNLASFRATLDGFMSGKASNST